jgi:hypothetical protein
MTYLILGLTCFAWIFCLISLKRVAALQSKLVQRLGHTRLKRLANLLFIAPILVISIVVVIYLAFWHTDPLLRFAHMIWVLGLWMLGTLSLFTFMLPARTKLIYPFLALPASVFSIAAAIYFTPLPTFATVFVDQPGMFLAVAIGFANLGLNWMVVHRVFAIS